MIAVSKMPSTDAMIIQGQTLPTGSDQHPGPCCVMSKWLKKGENRSKSRRNCNQKESKKRKRNPVETLNVVNEMPAEYTVNASL
jgi:hypothetical protein